MTAPLILPPSYAVIVFGADHRKAQHVEAMHRQAALLLGLRAPINVVIADDQVPAKYLAITTRRTDGVFRIVYRHKAVSPRVIAHETCHAATQGHLLDPTGWSPYLVGTADIPRLEKAADACARRIERRLISGGAR